MAIRPLMLLNGCLLFNMAGNVKYIKCRRFGKETFGLRKGDMEHTELSGGQKPAYILYTMLCGRDFVKQ